jgi:hypothetical protein
LPAVLEFQFQFQYGAIESSSTSGTKTPRLGKHFNSSMVRLKVSSQTGYLDLQQFQFHIAIESTQAVTILR